MPPPHSFHANLRNRKCVINICFYLRKSDPNMQISIHPNFVSMYWDVFTCVSDKHDDTYQNHFKYRLILLQIIHKQVACVHNVYSETLDTISHNYTVKMYWRFSSNYEAVVEIFHNTTYIVMFVSVLSIDECVWECAYDHLSMIH